MEGDDRRRSHPRCHARSGGDRSKGLLSEHLLTRALLDRIAASAGWVYVRGFSWQESTVEQIGIKRLSCKLPLLRSRSLPLSAARSPSGQERLQGPRLRGKCGLASTVDAGDQDEAGAAFLHARTASRPLARFTRLTAARDAWVRRGASAGLSRRA